LENRKQLPGPLGPNSTENKHRPTGSQVAPAAHGLGQLGYGLSTLQPSGTVPPWCCATHMGHTGARTHGGCRPAGEPTDGAGRDQPRHAEDMGGAAPFNSFPTRRRARLAARQSEMAST
jgi:hypothetical protein